MLSLQIYQNFKIFSNCRGMAKPKLMKNQDVWNKELVEEI